MKIVAFSGSNSSSSINKKLVRFCLNYFPEAEIILLDLNDFEMPIFSIDRERTTGFPPETGKFIEQIACADVLICSMAEHNSNFTVAFKNILDWTSRVKLDFFQQKPMFLMSTSPGSYGGGNVMQLALKLFPKLGVSEIVSFSLPKFNENFSSDEGILNTAFKTQFEVKMQEFQKLIS